MSASSNYALRLPASLKGEVERIARDDGVSLNQFIVTAVAEKLATLRTVEFFAERAARADREKALRIMRRKGGEPPREDDRIDNG